MTVYVDDMMMRAKVGRWDAKWCHLIADSREELHAFAERLGLKRAYFQEPKGLGGQPPRPGSYAAESWHYDVTASKRAEAITLGAVAIRWLDTPTIIKARMAGTSLGDLAARLSKGLDTQQGQLPFGED
jgi:hypothetical protein